MALLSVVGIAMIVLSGAFVFHTYEAQLNERIYTRVMAMTGVVARAVGNARSVDDVDFVLRAFGGNAPISLIAVADGKGNIFAASQPDWTGLSVLRLVSSTVLGEVKSGDKALVRSPNEDTRFLEYAREVELPYSGERGTLFVRLNTKGPIESIQATAWSILVWLTAGIIVSVLTISLVMQRIVVGPIEALRLYAERRGNSPFAVPKGPPDELTIVARALADSFNATSANEERLADLAQTDGLTGLGNRSFFKSRLNREIARAGQSGHMVGVMILNLDSFKDINDTLGHDAGDIILQRTAEILKNCQRKGDTVARLGADEFGVILSGLSSSEESADFAARFIRAVGAPFRVSGHELHQTACVGLTIFPQDGRDPDVLLKNADLALSRAKQEGSGACILYRHELHLRAMERNSIERDLRAALAQKQFVLYYQPKVDIVTGKVSGSEALIRWLHPERGLVPPDLFIPVAERCGFISDVTKWVLDEACRQNRAWQDAGLPKIGVAVNVSAVDLRRPDLTDTVANTLVTRALSPQYLELEVTESMVMRDVDVVIGTLRRLRSLGVGIGIDDFGTGYSSLAYLKRFPVKRLKIDRSFVRDIADAREGKIIPKVIIDLAHALGLNVLAEGVEDVAQLEILRTLGCDEAQGYFLGRPMPAAEFETFLRNSVGGLHPDAAIRAITDIAPSGVDAAKRRGLAGSAA
ncbi:MAG: EAL domain-containing protein [Parvibaculum sp.]|uniref:putative bifunctional diguanylate cyclase/phosphodiesterase n=1 Tax=Parvibaculum sp. TaxID=2024848 RepID=UPI0025E82BE8|nr:bifunctional diguanylate cyclase/phosphodiesterase [Parvibaculum sp.]MCE9649079.1 EAL domain-containing protein [Parvibaculum sp.]